MWAVFKYKKNEYNILRESLKEKLGNLIKFYNPKIKYTKFNNRKNKVVENYILGGYAFCFFDNFKDKKFISKLNYTKGLEYFLEGHLQEQKQIEEFVNLCKKNEIEKGYLSQNFFSNLILEKTRFKFLNGPFSNMIFEIIEKKKNKIKILLGGIKTVVENKSSNFYTPVY